MARRSVKDGPSGMWNHLAYKHKDVYIRLKASNGTISASVSPTAVVGVPAAMRDNLHRMHARWLTKTKRPLVLPSDPYYRDIFKVTMQGVRTCPPTRQRC